MAVVHAPSLPPSLPSGGWQASCSLLTGPALPELSSLGPSAAGHTSEEEERSLVVRRHAAQHHGGAAGSSKGAGGREVVSLLTRLSQENAELSRHVQAAKRDLRR